MFNDRLRERSIPLPLSLEALTEYSSKTLFRFELLLPYLNHFALDIDVQRWIWTMNLPPSHPESFHPCLVNAICLIGCSLDPRLPKEWEAHFYRSARAQMQQSLSLCDRIEDWMYTTVLLINYMVFRGRPLGVRGGVNFSVMCENSNLLSS